MRIDGGGRVHTARLLAMALVVAGAVVGLGMTAARFAFALPEPTGAFPVGTIAVRLPRKQEAGERAGATFAVQIWYPGQPSSERAPYGTGSGGLRRRLYHRLVRTHAAPAVAVATATRPFPVLVYAAGWGGERTDNTVLAEDLASHGFVVAAFGDLDWDVPPLARLAAPPDFGSHDAYQATVRLGAEKLEYQASRASQVLDYLATLGKDDPTGRFTTRLDTTRAGILGFSFGGAVALKASRRDPRFKAAVNMDGWIFDAGSGYGGGVAYFLISNGAPTPGPADVSAADPVRRYTSQFTVVDEERQLDVLRYGGYSLSIAGADHLNFTDVPLYAPLHRFARGVVDPERLAHAVREYTVAFFEHELRGVPSILLTPGVRERPAMMLSSWPLRTPHRAAERPHDATF